MTSYIGLCIYRDLPLQDSTLIDLVDIIVGDGSTVSWTLVNKPGSRVNSVIMQDGNFLQKFTDFTVSGNNIVFTNPPPNGSINVIPGLSWILAGPVFDQTTIPGLTNPNIIEVPFWVGNSSLPSLYSWEIPPGASGISIYPTDLIGAGLGAQTSWCQLSPASTDVTGTPTGYGSAGATLYTTAINGADNFVNSTSAGTSTSITVTDSSSFIAGDFVLAGSGTSNAEVCQIASIPDGTHLVLAVTQNPHAINETIFSCARKFWLKVTVPVNAAGGNPESLYNIGIGKTYVTLARE